jgi:23S rRNA (uracil1939-C5)-methyltransferase
MVNKSASLFELEVERLVYGGDAMGRLPDGRAVFFPFALPGEKVSIQLTEEKKRFARAELLDVFQPSPSRIEPRCPHFGICGGCHYQHMSYEQQIETKTDILREQFARIAGISDSPLLPIHKSTPHWNYRNRLQFHLSGHGKVSFVAIDGRSLMEVEACYLPQPEIDEVWPGLDFEPGLEIDRVELVQGTDGEVLLILEAGPVEIPEFVLDIPISAVHLVSSGSVVLAGDDHVIMQVKDRDFLVSAGSFFQVNPFLTADMVNTVLEDLDPASTDRVMDVYCGVGLFSAFLAPHVRSLSGIEFSPYATQDFAYNLDEFSNVTLYEGEAEEVLPQVDEHIDKIIVDPPRSGLGRKVVDTILQLNPHLISYVSCDPATLARDTARLHRGGYSLEKITPFDLFPHSYHIETISLFKKG